MRDALAGSTEEQVRTLHKMLASTKESAASDMQRSVHRNYTEFVDISKVCQRNFNDVLLCLRPYRSLRETCQPFVGCCMRRGKSARVSLRPDPDRVPTKMPFSTTMTVIMAMNLLILTCCNVTN